MAKHKRKQTEEKQTEEKQKKVHDIFDLETCVHCGAKTHSTIFHYTVEECLVEALIDAKGLLKDMNEEAEEWKKVSKKINEEIPPLSLALVVAILSINKPNFLEIVEEVKKIALSFQERNNAELKEGIKGIIM